MSYMREFNSVVTHVLIRQMPDAADLFPNFNVVLKPPTTPPASLVRAADPPIVAAPQPAPLHSEPPLATKAISDSDSQSLDTYE